MHGFVINSEAERNTMAMLCSPNITKEIEPLDQLLMKKDQKVQEINKLCWEILQLLSPREEGYRCT